MISTRLSLCLRKDCVALAELNLVFGLEVVELPADEHVVVGVLVCRNKIASPVDVDAKLKQILLSKRWEKIQPVIGMLELRDIFFRDTQLLQDFILSQGRPNLVSRGRFTFSCSWLVAACFSLADLTL